MAHSVELLFDADNEAVVRAMWQALDDAGLPSQVRVKSPTNRPHITLLAAQRISPEVDDVLRCLADRFPVPCAVGAPVVFGGHHDPQRRSASAMHTLARLIVPSAELLALQEEIYRLSMRHLTGEPFPHCRPGHWTAHVTLGRRLTAEQIGAAIRLISGAGNDLGGDIVGLRRWDSDERIDRVLVG